MVSTEATEVHALVHPDLQARPTDFQRGTAKDVTKPRRSPRFAQLRSEHVASRPSMTLDHEVSSFPDRCGFPLCSVLEGMISFQT